MKTITNIQFPNERDLYNQKDIHLLKCSFCGEEDGESALKECSNIICEDTLFALRYPMWHCNGLNLKNVKLLDTCRAGIWYSKDIKIDNSDIYGIKAIRECSNLKILNTKIISNEFCWKTKNIYCDKINVEGNYLFLECQNIKINNSTISGKYNFQYINNCEFDHCVIKSKDFFWHAKDVVIKDSIIDGEYLAWYSENLTLINCKISGTQPFCYCKNLKLIHCIMENTDLSFEYSSVEADIDSNIVSVKNPISGYINAESIDEIIISKDSKYESEIKIHERNK